MRISCDVQPRTGVLGVAVSTVNMREALRLTGDLIQSGGHGYICAVDAHSVVEAMRDAKHRHALNGAYLTTADGMPLVWIGKLRGHSTMGRVYGPDFLLEICRVSVQRGWRHFFYGGTAGVAEMLSKRLAESFPGLEILGSWTPPFRPLTAGEETELAERIDTLRPHILWVGLGAPKQERFMAEHCGKLQCPVMVGVGAAFDFHAGVVKEAPYWLHRTGMQWAYRVAQEPRRLGRRYLACIPAFIWNVCLEFAGLRSFPLNT